MAAAPEAVTRPRKPATPWTRWAALVLVLAITAWSVRETGFSLIEIWQNVSRGQDLLSQFFPPAWGVLDALFEPYIETLQIAILGSVFGVLLARPIAFAASSNTAPGRVVRAVDRFAMNVLRTMPDLFWALLFATAVGAGAFAGTIALTVFSAAVMSKLLSETVDAVDTGPLEAVKATGASRSLAVRKSVVPQVTPAFMAYAFYIFELNVRASVVLGLAGAGGVGNVLNRWRQFFNYDRILVLVIVTVIIVLVLDAIGAAVRRRLV